MDNSQQAQFIIDFFNDIWRILLVESPCFGLTFAQILLGVFIITFLIKIFKWIFTPDMDNSKDSGSGRIKND